MAICTVCGNDYDATFSVIDASGAEFVFDTIECAAHVLAPLCVNCGVRVLGHGVQDESHVFCCAHCARHAGTPDAVDRISSGS